MTAFALPMFQKDWDKLNKDAIAGTLDMVLSGELSGIIKSRPRSRAGQIVHGMGNFVGFLCTFDVPLATQITLLGRWVKWGFDMCRPSYLKYVKEIIGEDEYLAYQKRAWMCQRFESIRFAKGLFDTKKEQEAIAFLEEKRVIGEFSNRFGNQIVKVDIEDVLEFIKIYDHRGFFALKNIEGKVSFEKFQEKHNSYLKAMLSDLKKTSPEDFVKREREIIKHGINKTGILQNKHMDIDAVVEKAQKRAISSITPPVNSARTSTVVIPTKEDITPPIQASKDILASDTIVNEPKKPITNKVLYEEVCFNTIEKSFNGKTVGEPFWAFKKIEEALESPFLMDIKENDLVLTYGVGGKYFAYRKKSNGEFMMIEKLSMHPMLQADFEKRMDEIKPSEMTLMMQRFNIN